MALICHRGVYINLANWTYPVYTNFISMRSEQYVILVLIVSDPLNMNKCHEGSSILNVSALRPSYVTHDCFYYTIL